MCYKEIEIKLSFDELIKAVECCIENRRIHCNDKDCPLFNQTSDRTICRSALRRMFVKLIRCQAEENDRLTKDALALNAQHIGKTIQNNLKPCPFCGGEAEIKYFPYYATNALCVSCKTCNSRTMTIAYDCTYIFFEGKSDVFVTKEMAEKRSTERWNRRVDVNAGNS